MIEKSLDDIVEGECKSEVKTESSEETITRTWRIREEAEEAERDKK